MKRETIHKGIREAVDQFQLTFLWAQESTKESVPNVLAFDYPSAKQIIVFLDYGEDGWEALRPASTSNNIELTMEALELLRS